MRGKNVNYRIFVEKKEGFQIEARALLEDFNQNLDLDLKTLNLLNVYDLFGFNEDLLEKTKYGVFADVRTDNVYESFNLTELPFIAVEPLPGQFDQRASSAIDCVRLIDPNSHINIKSSQLLVFDNSISKKDLQRIKDYYINRVESREKNLSKLDFSEEGTPLAVPVIEGFRGLTVEGLSSLIDAMGLAMSSDDIKCVQDYFKAEGRDPNETEIRILDTYWSDHCRHTTFNTIIESITIEESFIKKDLQEALDTYKKMKQRLGKESSPFRVLLFIGTPITGTVVKAAITPGR
jgi:phosphoribosylformylglycinamidine synthase